MSFWQRLYHQFRQPRRRWSAVEVIQTSATDCGPAALKSLLEGFYIPAGYGRLREACQTSIDGTSIDDIEIVARRLGLDAEQVMLPKDYLWLSQAEALPAMVVVQQSTGATHFVILWRRCGSWLQIMDPGAGRRWVKCRQFERELFVHSLSVPADQWCTWAGSDQTLRLLDARVRALGACASAAAAIVRGASESKGWQRLAALDAALRMLASLDAARALPSAAHAIVLLETLLARTAEEKPGACVAIPSIYWSVRPAQDDTLLLRGAVLLRIRGRLPMADDAAQSLSPDLAAALAERPPQPLRELWRLAQADGLFAPLALFCVLGLSAGGLTIEALLFRSFFNLGSELSMVSQRLLAFGALLTFVCMLAVFESPIIRESMRIGRHLETRLRLLLAQKLPLVNDRYLQSRPISDMAERAHGIHHSRHLPDLAIRFVRTGWDLLLTLLAIAFVSLQSMPLACLIVILAVSVLSVAQPALRERDMRVHSQAAALHVFYLDALLGMAPIRTHSAERSVRREHEGLLTQWVRAARHLLRLTVLIKATQSLLCISLAVWLMFKHIETAGGTGDLLLVVYWVLKLPSLAEAMTVLALQYPAQRNVMLRLLEPINAATDSDDARQPTSQQPPLEQQQARKPGPYLVRNAAGVAIDLQGVGVVAAGQQILRELNLSIRPGEHIAVIGSSGAGKSSLLGLLLGWQQAAAGAVLVDGELLTKQRLRQLRAETAWVDPTIQLWNRSLLANLRYSSSVGPHSALTQILDHADLAKTLVQLPQGLQSALAEGGASLSGGEGQRVRLGRALWQQGVRLVLLDEPFRGLDREQRQRQLVAARRLWQDATLICVTHDVSETRTFNRVLVVEDGRIIEDGRPEELTGIKRSRYRSLLDAEEALRHELWNAILWRRIRLDNGRIQESSRLPTAGRNAARHE